MKRTFILIAAGVMLAGTFGFAEKSTLIDFSKLSADIIPETKTDAEGKTVAVTGKAGNPVNTQNKRTCMDYGVAAGATFTNDQKALMKTSLAISNWEVKLNSSSQTITALALSETKEAVVKTTKKDSRGNDVNVDLKFDDGDARVVMGVRVLFPTWTANSNAKIVPPFEIQAYEPLINRDENGNKAQESTDEANANAGKYLFEDGYGLVKNVGTLKSISVTTMGMNFPHGLYVLLKDNDNVERRYFMGYLNFDGWKTLVWNNPEYISEVRTREIRVYPIYPRGTPFVKFAGFQVTRDAADDGDNFIGYFKDVKVIYDKALLTSDRDIDDENLWGIITSKEAARQNGEMSRFGNNQVNRYLENEKMAGEDEVFKTSDYSTTNDSASQNATAASAK